MPRKLPGDNILMTDQANICAEITAGGHGTLNRCSGSVVTSQGINNNAISFCHINTTVASRLIVFEK
jgi:hypothetical protein